MFLNVLNFRSQNWSRANSVNFFLSCTQQSRIYWGTLYKNDYESQTYISAKLRWIYDKNYGSSWQWAVIGAEILHHHMYAHQSYGITKVYSIQFLPNASKMELRFYCDLGFICNRDTNLELHFQRLSKFYTNCTFSFPFPQDNNPKT